MLPHQTVTIVKRDGETYQTDALFKMLTHETPERKLVPLCSQYAFKNCLICGDKRFSEEEWQNEPVKWGDWWWWCNSQECVDILKMHFTNMSSMNMESEIASLLGKSS
jgi:hypothetical protein